MIDKLIPFDKFNEEKVFDTPTTKSPSSKENKNEPNKPNLSASKECLEAMKNYFKLENSRFEKIEEYVNTPYTEIQKRNNLRGEINDMLIEINTAKSNFMMYLSNEDFDELKF